MVSKMIGYKWLSRDWNISVWSITKRKQWNT